MSSPASIAIDGPVASGKTAVGRLVAERLGCRFLDTGAMYRGVTWAAIKRGIDLQDPDSLAKLASELEITIVPSKAGDRLVMDGEDVTEHLRSPQVEQGVSLVASISGVRSAMVSQQRSLAKERSIVMVGRDIGTVVLPDAPVKVFLKASVDVRARRRFRELVAQGSLPDYQQVVDDLARRDKIDSERTDSPLRPAEGALQIDTDRLEIDEVVEKVLSVVGCC